MSGSGAFKFLGNVNNNHSDQFKLYIMHAPHVPSTLPVYPVHCLLYLHIQQRHLCVSGAFRFLWDANINHSDQHQLQAMNEPYVTTVL